MEGGGARPQGVRGSRAGQGEGWRKREKWGRIGGIWGTFYSLILGQKGNGPCLFLLIEFFSFWAFNLGCKLDLIFKFVVANCRGKLRFLVL